MTAMPAKPKPRARTKSALKKTAKPRKPAQEKQNTSARKPKAQPGKFGIRTAPKGDRFYAPEMAIRKFALGMPQASEDFPWGHRAFRVGKKVFLFLAWDAGVFSLTARWL